MAMENKQCKNIIAVHCHYCPLSKLQSVFGNALFFNDKKLGTSIGTRNPRIITWDCEGRQGSANSDHQGARASGREQGHQDERHRAQTSGQETRGSSLGIVKQARLAQKPISDHRDNSGNDRRWKERDKADANERDKLDWKMRVGRSTGGKAAHWADARTPV